MRRELQKVTVQGYYVLSTDRHNFTNAGIREACHSTDNRIILAILR